MSFEGTIGSGPVCSCCGDVHPPPCVKIDTADFVTDWEDMGGGIFLSQHDWGERPNDPGNFAALGQGLRIFLDLTAGGPSAAVDLIAGWTDADNYNYVRYQPAGESDLLSLWQVRDGTHTLLNGFHRMEPRGSLTLSYCWYIAYWLQMGSFCADTYTPEGELFFTAGAGVPITLSQVYSNHNYFGPYGRRFGFRGDPSAFSRFRLIWHTSTDPHAPCPTLILCRFCADHVPLPCVEVTGHPPNGNTLFGPYEADLNGVHPLGLTQWGGDTGPPEQGNFGGFDPNGLDNLPHNGNCVWAGLNGRPTKPDGTEMEIVNGGFVLGVLWHADEELYYLWLGMHIPHIVCGGCKGGNIQNYYWGTARYRAIFGPNAPDCTSRGRFKMELFDSNIRRDPAGFNNESPTSDPIDHELEEIWVDLDGECQIYYQEDIGCCDFEDLPAHAWLMVGGLESEPVLLMKHVSEQYYSGSSFAGEEHLRFYELQCFLLDPENNIRRWILSQSDVGLFCQLATRSCGPFHLTEPTPQSCIYEIEVTE